MKALAFITLFFLYSCQQSEINAPIDAPEEVGLVPELPQISYLENFEVQVQDQFKKQYQYIEMFSKEHNDKYAYSVAKLGKIFQAYNKFPQAIDCYLIALNIDKDNYEIMYLLATNYKYTGYNDLALEYYNKSLNINETIPALLAIAEIHSQRNEWLMAKEFFNKVLVKDANHYRALYGMATINRAENHPDKAIKKLLKIIKNQPNAYHVNYQLGQLYAQKNQKELAQKYLKIVKDTQNNKIEIKYSDPFLKSVSDFKINSQHLATLGLQALQNNNINQAIILFEKASKANDEKINIKYNLAIAYFKSGQVQKAQNLAEQILVREPNHKLSQVMLDKIDKFYEQEKLSL